MSIESIFKDDRELSVLHAVMLRNEMSAEAVVRHFFRMGQLVDHHLQAGQELGYLDDQGDFVPIFQHGPKLAPMPDTSTWDSEGGAIPRQRWELMSESDEHCANCRRPFGEHLDPEKFCP